MAFLITTLDISIYNRANLYTWWNRSMLSRIEPEAPEQQISFIVPRKMLFRLLPVRKYFCSLCEMFPLIGVLYKFNFIDNVFWTCLIISKYNKRLYPSRLNKTKVVHKNLNFIFLEKKLITFLCQFSEFIKKLSENMFIICQNI